MLRFTEGATVARREVLHGSVWLSMPVTVVADDGQILVVRLDPGAPMSFPLHPFGPHPWSGQTSWGDTTVLQIHRDGDWYAIWRMFDGERDLGWYVNFEAPMTRGRDCFDTEDYGLDIVIATDGSWTWKDLDDPVHQVVTGRVSPELLAELRGKATDVEMALNQGERWWSAWDDWRPSVA